MSTPFFDKLKFKKLSQEARSPTKVHGSDAGVDLYSLNYYEFHPGEQRIVNTGVCFELPKHSYGKIFDRSSMSVNGWRVGAGVIDQSYTGECKVVIQNMTNRLMKIEPGQKIAQLVVMPVFETELEEIQELPKTERGSNGFGSSGE